MHQRCEKRIDKLMIVPWPETPATGISQFVMFVGGSMNCRIGCSWIFLRQLRGGNSSRVKMFSSGGWRTCETARNFGGPGLALLD